MPKSKNPDAFPYAYYETFKAVVDGRKIVVNLDTKKEAEALRFDMYGYRNALEYTRDPFYSKSASIVAKIRVNLTGGYDLILTSVIDDPINSKLMSAIHEVGHDLNSSGTNSDLNSPSSKVEASKVEANPLTYTDGTPWNKDIIMQPAIPPATSGVDEDTNEQSVYKAYMPSPSPLAPSEAVVEPANAEGDEESS